MKNKFSKFFVALLSTFLIFGGVIFTACNEKPVASISVSSEIFNGRLLEAMPATFQPIRVE